jgi:L-ascorbate metabolism protein UlaG (beta-lactamase superfamily)
MKFYAYAFTLLIVLGCKPISVSKLRNNQNHSLILNKDFKITTLEPVHLNYFGVYQTEFFQSGFRINYKKTVIYIDPIEVTDSIKADYILITHPHKDHFSITDIKTLCQPNTLIIGPKQLEKKLKDYKFQPILPRKKMDLGNFTIETLPAYNIKEHKIGMAWHSVKKNYLGYILTFDDIKIYHAGDTDFIPEMAELKHITIAMVPIGEKFTAMHPKEAAEALNVIQPRFVIPMHYELNKNRVDSLKINLSSLIKIETLGYH